MSKCVKCQKVWKISLKPIFCLLLTTYFLLSPPLSFTHSLFLSSPLSPLSPLSLLGPILPVLSSQLPAPSSQLSAPSSQLPAPISQPSALCVFTTFASFARKKEEQLIAVDFFTAKTQSTQRKCTNLSMCKCTNDGPLRFLRDLTFAAFARNKIKFFTTKHTKHTKFL